MKCGSKRQTWKKAPLLRDKADTIDIFVNLPIYIQPFSRLNCSSQFNNKGFQQISSNFQLLPPLFRIHRSPTLLYSKFHRINSHIRTGMHVVKRRGMKLDERQRRATKVLAKQLEQQVDDDDEFIEVSADVQTHLTAQKLTNRTTLATTDSLLNQSRLGNNRRILPINIQTSQDPPNTPTRPPPDGVKRRIFENVTQNEVSHSAFAQKEHSAKVVSESSLHNNGATFPQKGKQTLNQPQQLATTTISPKYDYINKLYLDSNMPLNVEAHIGNTAYMVCRLRSMYQQDHLRVSWVKNMQILTSGEFRYTSDERFQPTHIAGTHDWILEIHNVNANDEGYYECQVNSEPKPASVSLYLHVIATSIEILEAPQVNFSEYDQIRLTCRVEFNSQAELNRDELLIDESELTTTKSLTRAGINRFLSSQHYIYWYKDRISLEYNNPRGGIRVERRENSSNLESILSIEDATNLDTGLYMCKILPELYDVQPAQVQVLVGGISSSSATGLISDFVLFKTEAAVILMFVYIISCNTAALLLLHQPFVRPR